MKEISICVKQLGKKYPVIREKKISIDVSSSQCNLRDILELIVKQEVNAHNKKIEEQLHGRSEKKPEDILIQYGKITFGDTYNTEMVDVESAKNIAIDAFKDGLFRVFYGDDEISSLEEELDIATGKTFSFIRLTFLTGTYW